MRIIINLDRVEKKKLRIRSGFYFNTGDDIRLKNCGVALYNQWENVLDGLKCDGTVIVNEGEKK